MIIQVKSLYEAIQKVKSFADTTQQVNGILFNLNGNQVSVCFSDGKKSIIEKLEVEQEDNDISGKIIVNYAKLLATMDMLQKGNNVYTIDMNMQFDVEKKCIHIKADKYMNVNRAVGIDADGDTVYEEETKKISDIDQILAFEYPEDSIKYGLLSRMDYDGIFKGEDELEKCDQWDVGELRGILSSLISDKSSTVYVSASKQAAFVVNMVYTQYIPIEMSFENGFSLNAGVAKALVDILAKLGNDENVFIIREDRYLTIFNDSDTLGIWMEIAPVSKTHATSLASYQSKDYTRHELVFYRNAILDAVTTAANSMKDERISASFVKEGEDIYMAFAINNSGASISVDFKVYIEGQKDLNYDELKEFKVPVSIKALMDMINNCKTNHIALDFAVDVKPDGSEGGKFLRVGELLGRDENGAKVYYSMNYTVVGRV